MTDMIHRFLSLSLSLQRDILRSVDITSTSVSETLVPIYLRAHMAMSDTEHL